MKKNRFIIGIDEVGRGPLAGPVTVCVFAMPVDFEIDPVKYSAEQFNRVNKKLPLRDSKKLTLKQREEWFKILKKYKKEKKVFYSIISAPPSRIDKMNISNATNYCATKGVNKIFEQIPSFADVEIFLDGGLFLRTTEIIFPQQKKIKIKKIETIIKGDEKIPAISLASIVAKNTRDRKMKKIHEQYPEYHFIKNVGYGTKLHREAITKYGPLKIHRKSFLTNTLKKIADKKRDKKIID